MLFNSYQFIIFFPIITAIYYLLPKTWMKNLLLLTASYYFYGSWKQEYLLLILIATATSYLSAVIIFRLHSSKFRTMILISNFAIIFGILFVFKYFNFASATLNRLFIHVNNTTPFKPLNVLLPVGISFYTFQIASYVIDVYRKKIQPEKRFLNFALFVSFFPQLVAGPIERAKNLLPQFLPKHNLNPDKISDGIRLMAWGFFQKIVIADRLAEFADKTFGNPSMYTNKALLLGVYFFAFQIYCDFSGYTNIARGAAKILGFDLMENFHLPYFAKSLQEFWRRWHISLSTWFKDYIYIPLGGNRVSKKRWILNILFVFALTGLWHGAGWNFALWGMYHGIILVCENFLRTICNKKISLLKKPAEFFKPGRFLFREQLFNQNNLTKVKSFIQIIFTFHIVLFGWIFFRVQGFQNISDFFYELFNFGPKPNGIWDIKDKPSLTLAFFLVVFLIVIEYIRRRIAISEYFLTKPRWIRFPIYIIFAILLLALGKMSEQEFIYFQF